MPSSSGTMMESDVESALSRLLLDSEERVTAILGRRYLASVLLLNNPSKSIFVLSNRRLYQQGQAFQVDGTGAPQEIAGRKTIPNEVIGSVSYRRIGRPRPLRFALVSLLFTLLVAGFFGYGLSQGWRLQEGEGILMSICVAIMAIPTIFFFLLYWLRPRHFILIELTTGEKLLVPCDWYEPTEIGEFFKSVSTLFVAAEKQPSSTSSASTDLYTAD